MREGERLTKKYSLPDSFPAGIVNMLKKSNLEESQFIVSEISLLIRINEDQRFPKSKTFDVDNKMLHLMRESNRLGFFSSRRIEPEDWQDIAEKNIAIIIQFLEGDFKTFDEIPGYEDLVKLRQTRIKELAESGKYGIDVMEWYNPAW